MMISAWLLDWTHAMVSRIFYAAVGGKISKKRFENGLLFLLTFVFAGLLYSYVSNQALVMTEVSFRRLMVAREKHRSSVCAKYAADSVELQPNRRTNLHYYAFLSEKRHYLWCPVYKAASTSWIYNLMKVEGLGPGDIRDYESLYGKNHANEILRQIIPQVMKNKFKKIVTDEEQSLAKFMIVRHPFSRLVSAFRDKLERYNEKYYREFGIHMVAKYRGQAKERFPHGEFRQVCPPFEKRRFFAERSEKNSIFLSFGI